jgi:hypothetical protein
MGRFWEWVEARIVVLLATGLAAIEVPDEEDDDA